jgi:hypothetical protein
MNSILYLEMSCLLQGRQQFDVNHDELRSVELIPETNTICISVELIPETNTIYITETLFKSTPSVNKYKSVLQRKY